MNTVRGLQRLVKAAVFLLQGAQRQGTDAVQGSANRHFKRTFRGASKTPWPVQKLELPLFLHDAHEVVLYGELVESNC
jgi:hypothetical protein